MLQSGREDIRLIPSAISADRNSRRAVILAASIPAKKFNIRTGESLASALLKCPDLFLAKPDFEFYRECSEQMFAICREYTPLVEKFSIDECFMDMSGMQLIYEDLMQLAEQLRERIYSTLGFTVNIGVGSNRLLAKTASDFEKPNRVHSLFTEELQDKFWILPISALFSVGRSTDKKLQKAGITTIGAAAAADLRRLQRLLGVKAGTRIHEYANGLDNSPVRSGERKAKGYSASKTMEHDLILAEEAYKVLLFLADSVASAMRADNRRCSVVTVTIRDPFFNDLSHQKQLPMPTDITSEIFEISRQLFDELWNLDVPIRLLGVAISGVSSAACEQLSLFPEPQRDRMKRLDLAIDKIRGKFGKNSIHIGEG